MAGMENISYCKKFAGVINYYLSLRTIPCRKACRVVEKEVDMIRLIEYNK